MQATREYQLTNEMDKRRSYEAITIREYEMMFGGKWYVPIDMELPEDHPKRELGSFPTMKEAMEAINDYLNQPIPI